MASQDERKPARWQPGSLFEEMQSDLLRLFEAWPLRRSSLAEAIAMPRVDVFEKDGNIVVKAELPGVKKDDIDLEVAEGNLVLRAERKEAYEIEEKDWYRMERTTGQLYRRIPLPEGVETEGITATLEEGVLEVTIPKPTKSETKSTKISITD